MKYCFNTHRVHRQFPKNLQARGSATASSSAVFVWHLPCPLLRDVRRAEPLSPGVSPRVSPREALGSLQAATAALLGFMFILERYGDPAHSHTVCKRSWNFGEFVTASAHTQKTEQSNWAGLTWRRGRLARRSLPPCSLIVNKYKMLKRQGNESNWFV